MKRMKMSCLGLLLVGLLAGRAGATSVLPQNLAQLSETAESAFVVRIDSMETSSSGDRHFDVITGVVTEPVFGNIVTSQPISWRQFRFSQRAAFAGMPRYEPGREYLVFLSGMGRGTDFQAPIGLQQGAFEVIRNPATGAALARNALGNLTLSNGLDTTTVARNVAAEQVRRRAVSPGEQQARATQLQQQLRTRPGGNSLEAIKEAARHFHAEKMRGRMPSRDYATTASGVVVRRPLHL